MKDKLYNTLKWIESKLLYKKQKSVDEYYAAINRHPAGKKLKSEEDVI